jgi:Zn-dependent protease with chaperone function
MSGTSAIVMRSEAEHGLGDRRPPGTSRRWKAVLKAAAAVLTVTLAQFGLVHLPAARVEANPAFSKAKPMESEFLRGEEARAKQVLGVRNGSRYILLPMSYGSPAATALIGGRHVIGVSQQLLDLAKSKPDIVSAIVAHEVSHEWVHENRGDDSFLRTHGFAVASLAVSVLACLWGLGHRFALAVGVFGVGFAAGMYMLSPSVRTTFEITSVAALAGAMVSVFLFVLPDLGSQKRLAVMWRVTGAVVVAAGFALLLLWMKPALDRENELEADRFALRVMAASGRSHALLPTMCWLESLSATAGHPLLAIALDHPTNDERLRKLGFSGIGACAK